MGGLILQDLPLGWEIICVLLLVSPLLHSHIGLVHSQIFETATSEIPLTRIRRSKIGNPSRCADTLEA